MFNLIITLIAIALVASLSLASAYFGGQAFTQGGVKADIARFTNGGQHIHAAAALYMAENSRSASSAQDLIDGGFLAEEPWPKGTWLLGGGYSESPTMNEAQCLELTNRIGLTSIPQTRQPGYHEHCYGDSQPYTYAYLADGSAGGGILAGAPPSEPQNGTVTPPGMSDANGPLTLPYVVNPTSSSWSTAVVDVAKYTGRWYWEATVIKGGSHNIAGIGTGNVSASTSHYAGSDSHSWGYYGSASYTYRGFIHNNTRDNNYGENIGTGDVIGVALDIDNETVTFYKNCVSQGVGTMPLNNTNGLKPIFSVYGSGGSGSMEVNLGDQSFTCQVPAGYTAGFPE